MPDFPVCEFMSRTVVSVAPETPLTDVAASMRSARISCVVVCENRRPVGVISERDMVKLCGELLGGYERRIARDAMSAGIFTMTEHESCTSTLELLKTRQVRRMVIVDVAGQLAGVITQSDLLRAHARAVELQKDELEDRVRQRTRELADANARLEALSRVDPMLKIGNRRAMDEMLEKMEKSLERYGRQYALTLIDVDNFKKYNDHYGHMAGDVVLTKLAKIMRDTIRTPDDVFRYGGEEFLIIFPENDQRQAEMAAERVRAAIEGEAIPHELAAGGVVTVSMGVGAESIDQPNWSRLISRADEALYEAKAAGRNCVKPACPPDSALPLASALKAV